MDGLSPEMEGPKVPSIPAKKLHFPSSNPPPLHMETTSTDPRAIQRRLEEMAAADLTNAGSLDDAETKIDNEAALQQIIIEKQIQYDSFFASQAGQLDVTGNPTKNWVTGTRQVKEYTTDQEGNPQYSFRLKYRKKGGNSPSYEPISYKQSLGKYPFYASGEPYIEIKFKNGRMDTIMVGYKKNEEGTPNIPETPFLSLCDPSRLAKDDNNYTVKLDLAKKEIIAKNNSRQLQDRYSFVPAANEFSTPYYNQKQISTPQFKTGLNEILNLIPAKPVT